MANNLNKGSLFNNDRKSKENDPDFRGSVNVGGKEYWVAGWKKTPKQGGEDYLSLSLTEQEAQPQGQEGYQQLSNQAAYQQPVQNIQTGSGYTSYVGSPKPAYQSQPAQQKKMF